MIRAAGFGDMTAAGEIYVSGHWAAYRGAVPYASLRALNADVEGQSLQGELGKPQSVFLVAVNRAGRVVGFALGGVTDADATLGGLAELHVDRRYRRRGVGRLLTKAIAQRLGAMGVNKLTAVVAKCNAASRSFCQQLGAVEVDHNNTMPVFGNVPDVPTVDLPIVQVYWSEPQFAALL